MQPLTDDTIRGLFIFLVQQQVAACVDLDALDVFEQELAEELARLMPKTTQSDLIPIPRGMIAGALHALADAFADSSSPSPLMNGKA